MLLPIPEQNHQFLRYSILQDASTAIKNGLAISVLQVYKQ